MRNAFTLVEIMLAVLLASMLFGAIVTFFGDTLQRFVQHEDTLTGVRDIQLLLAYLRRDLSLIDGAAALYSSSSQTGTTFPKEYIHVCHSTLDDRLHCYRFQRVNDDDDFPDIDPLMTNMPDTGRTKELRKRIAYAENAAAWVIPDEDKPVEEQVRYLYLNVRDKDQRKKVIYVFRGASRTVERVTPERTILFADHGCDEFTVRPMFEFYTQPDEAEATAVLLKVFYEITLSLRAEDDGGRIEKRRMNFTTKVTPKLLNMAVKSRWSQ